MIYFVDEDVSQVRPFVTELLLRGLDVENIVDADEAFRRLSVVRDCDLAIIDVMLAVDIAAATSRYSRDSTAEFTRTGLRLLEDLAGANPLSFPHRAVLFSMASSDDVLVEVRQISRSLKVPFFHKAEFGTTHAFGEAIANRLQQVGKQ